MAIYYGDKPIWQQSTTGSTVIKSRQTLTDKYIYNGDTTRDLTITSVDSSKSVILTYLTQNYSNYYVADITCTADFLSDTSIRLERHTGGFNSAVKFDIEIIEFESATVQKINSTLATLNSTGYTITQADTTNSLLFLNYALETNKDEYCSVRPYFYSSTNVRTKGSHNQGDAVLWVVDFS